MTRKLLLAVAAALLAVAAFGPPAGANPPVVPLEDEPTPLSIDPDQWVFVVQSVPPSCSIVPDAAITCVEMWECPAGRIGTNRLSVGAQQRRTVPYNGIAGGRALASLPTHCTFLRTEYTAAALTVTVPNPTPSQVCPDGSLPTGAGLTCSPSTPSAPVSAPGPDELAFTGPATSWLADAGVGLLALGAVGVGLDVRRRNRR